MSCPHCLSTFIFKRKHRTSLSFTSAVDGKTFSSFVRCTVLG